MDEFEIIRRYFTPRKTGKRVIVGVGDDGAVLRPKEGRDIVSVVDSLVADVHFPPSLDAEDIGYRSVAVNLSDIAAMGARPRWMTVSLVLEEGEPDWLAGFANGLLLAGEKYGVELVGGDMTHGSQNVVTVQIIGDVKKGRAITRAGARKGDSIYVSGCVGDAAAGLSIIESSQPGSRVWAESDYLIRRFANPEARIALGRAIARHASAAIDLSDGLYADLGKLLAASGVSGVIEIDKLPLSDALSRMLDEDDAHRFALGGGDDYELCFTSGDAEIEKLGAELGVPITRIGKVKKGRGIKCRKDGERFDYDHAGYRHFK